MLVSRYAYSLINADLVTLQDSEILTGMIDIESYNKLYGVFVYSGYSTIVASEDTNIGYNWLPTGHFQPNTIKIPCDVQATGETIWVCVSQNDDIRREVLEQVVDGSYTLNAGWAFLVLDGSVTADGKTANKLQFFKARDTDIDVQGTGILLLIR